MACVAWSAIPLSSGYASSVRLLVQASADLCTRSRETAERLQDPHYTGPWVERARPRDVAFNYRIPDTHNPGQDRVTRCSEPFEVEDGTAVFIRVDGWSPAST